MKKTLDRLILIGFLGLSGLVGCSNEQKTREEALFEFHSFVDDEYRKYRQEEYSIKEFVKNFEEYKKKIIKDRLDDGAIYDNLKREALTPELAELFKKYMIKRAITNLK